MEAAPERKKLKSTYQAPAALPPLPTGWTEHAAPSGHKYYYHAASKQSTYTRPAAPIVAVAPPPPHPPPPSAHAQSSAPFVAGAPQDYAALAQSYAAGNVFPVTQHQQQQQLPPSYTVPPFSQHQDFGRGPSHRQRRPPPEDRPKRKTVVPDCAPWILVYTKLGRRFVHNTDTAESFWKFPPDVMKAVVEFDRIELEKKLAAKDEGTGANNVPVGTNNRNRRRSSATLQREDEAALAAMNADDGHDGHGQGAKVVPLRADTKTPGPEAATAEDSSEYEEIEVTDDEEEDDAEDQAATEQSAAQNGDQAVEFGEDDIAYQLAQLNAEYGLDPGEYDDGLGETYEEGAEGLPLTAEDSEALFHDLLSDHNVNPFAPWEPLLDNEDLISDERWTILPTTKARKEAWDSWTRLRIAHIKDERAKAEKQDPRIPYLRLLSEKATPKLYWPEFKRKFKKEPEMRDMKLADKDREKLYREHIARLKLPSSTLKSDLASLLRSLSLQKLNRDTDIAALPRELLADVRFISLHSAPRDELVKAHISTLPPAPEGEDAVSAEEQAEREKKRRERERRETALRERERRVDEDKRRRERDLRAGMGRLRDGERELEAAMKIGREGLRGQLDEVRTAPSSSSTGHDVTEGGADAVMHGGDSPEA